MSRCSTTSGVALGLAALLVVWPVAAASEKACASFAKADAGVGAAELTSERFRDNGDGTVTDLDSKLVWMRCSVGQRWQAKRCAGTAGTLTWDDAQRRALDANRAADAFYNDWRLPSLRELATITSRVASPECARVRTDLAAFPGTAPAAYWSATSRPGEGDGMRAFALGFGTSGVHVARKDERHHVRLVRTGP